MGNIEMVWTVGEKYTVTKYVDGTYSAAFHPGEDEPALVLATGKPDWYEAVRTVMAHMEEGVKRLQAIEARAVKLYKERAYCYDYGEMELCVEILGYTPEYRISDGLPE